MVKPENDVDGKVSGDEITWIRATWTTLLCMYFIIFFYLPVISFLCCSLGKCDPSWPKGQFVWKDHKKCLAEAGLVTHNYPDDTMLPGETKPDNLQAKGLANMWKSERKDMLAALGAPGVVHAKHLIHIEKVDDAHRQSK